MDLTLHRSGWGKAPSSQDNTNLLRAYRRAITRVIGARLSAAKFDSLLELEARRFLCRVLRSQHNFLDHIRKSVQHLEIAPAKFLTGQKLTYEDYRGAGAFILKITYGYNIESHSEDPLVNLANLALRQFSNAIIPGAWLVDLIPPCKSLSLTTFFNVMLLISLSFQNRSPDSLEPY